MKLQRWRPCSKRRPQIGRKPKKRCPSWCSPRMRVFCSVVDQYLMNAIFFFFVHLCSATRIYTSTRGTGFNRGGKPAQHQQHQPQQQPDRPLPPSYVCYRCGQKGSLNGSRRWLILTFLPTRSLDPRLSNKQRSRV